MNNEFGIIKINYDIFYKLLKEKENDDKDLPQPLINKANDLQNNYNCFASNYDARSLWEKKKYIASKIRNKDYKTIRAKPIILSTDFSDEFKCKKELTGYLNKLSDVNKHIIYAKIKNFIDTINKSYIHSLFDIIWTFIKKSSNNIYIDVLYLFNKDDKDNNLKTNWDKYMSNKEWIPPTYILETDILLKDENYDTFCDYIKWRKSSISVIRTWCNILIKEDKINNIDILLNNIMEIVIEYIENKSIKKHVLDIALDQIYTILDIHDNIEVIDKIKNWDISIFENSSRFKIYNILEKYDN